MRFKFTALCLLLTEAVSFICHAQNKPRAIKELAGCMAVLHNDTLTLTNDVMSRTYLWNNGDLRSLSLTDKQHHYTWKFNKDKSDAFFPNAGVSANGKFEMREIEATAASGPYVEAECIAKFAHLDIKRVFRIYPQCPAISCIYYLRGNIQANWSPADQNSGDVRNVEDLGTVPVSTTTVIEQLALPGKHWRVKAVQFFDITDQNNNLVQENDQLVYHAESHMTGNLLFADELSDDHGLFILKETPLGAVQLNYPGYDFAVSAGHIRAVGIGISPVDLDPEKWTRCYGFVTGVTAGGALGRLVALRTYQEKIRLHLPGRDEMVLMNTWGDRGQDKHIGERFTLKELKAAHRLGITHFQIDDGWQSGRSANSAFAGGSFNHIWRNPNYWKPDTVKFPNGLAPVVQEAKKLGIKVCLWFNPSKDSSYAHWQNDAQALIDLYKAGISTFKIDGVQVIDKRGEQNLRKMFDTVMLASRDQAVFNLDVTAGRRNGYHYFNEYGNVFLENRYTDWANYYPCWTLRNLWMLSSYVPPQNLQVEFLNNFRNADKYAKNDLLAPSNVNFEYTFALTMMAQPLAWMEATGLPEKAFVAAPVIKQYSQMQVDIHSGQIFPIGQQPSGMSWTGFQSIKNKRGYLLVIREGNHSSSNLLQTWLPPRKRVRMIALLGRGNDQMVKTDQYGRVRLRLAQKNSYALYSYQIL